MPWTPKHSCGVQDSVDYELNPVVSGMFDDFEITIPVLLWIDLNLDFVVVLKVNLSSVAANNGDVPILLIYHCLKQFIQWWFVVCC